LEASEAGNLDLPAEPLEEELEELLDEYFESPVGDATAFLDLHSSVECVLEFG
jgi:hypothetical protein